VFLSNTNTPTCKMNKGGVPDAWDDDWVRAADVSACSITYSSREYVSDNVA
jgi:hypothetical protein